MKKKIWQLCLIVAVLVAILVWPASAAKTSDLRCVVYPADNQTSTISIQNARMYLPSAADLHSMVFQFSGTYATLTSASGSVTVQNWEPCDISALWSERDLSNGFCSLTMKYSGTTVRFTMYRTENVASLYITSADKSKGRTWVEKDKENKAKDNGVLLLDENGAAVYSGKIKTMKGRGNSTWSYSKKPYQIKLADAVDLIQTGDEAEKEKTWVLLANYCDPTMIHNTFTYQLGQQIGLSNTPNSRPVDLYYDGQYRGLYQLCEKTEIGDGRIAINDLESDILDTSQVDDADKLATAKAKTAHGLSCQYVKGLTLPTDYSGGYLLEMDYMERATEEKSWFRTNRDQYIVCKSPEYLPLEGVDYISNLYQQFEDAVFNGGTHPVTGADYSQYIDVPSLAKCYCILELSQDVDSFMSSTFFYKPNGEEKLYAGPLWDFDSCYGSTDYKMDASSLRAGITAIGKKLLQIPSFRDAVADEYAEISKLITGTALSSVSYEKRTVLQTINYDTSRIAYSRQMDAAIWPETLNGKLFNTSVQSFKDFLSERNAYLTELTSSWEHNGGFYFNDVYTTSWYWEALKYCNQHDLLNGVSNTQFEPYGSVTRAMLTTVLYRMAGQPAVDPADNPFADVPDGRWYTNAVLWAYQNGIVNGVDAAHFSPDAVIQRQDMAVMLWRSQGGTEPAPESVGAAATAKDYNKVSSYARDAIAWAVASGIFQNDPVQGLMPGDYTSRAQLAVVLYRLEG